MANWDFGTNASAATGPMRWNLTIQPRALVATCGLFALFLLSFNYSGGPAGLDIDSSWSAVMSWGWSNRANWGSDLVFTYGPLSFLSQHFSFDPKVFSLAKSAQISYAALVTVLTGISLRASSMRTIALLLVAIWLYGDWLAGEVVWMTGYAVGLLAALQSPRLKPSRASAALVVTGVTMAIPVFVKFTNVPLWLLWMSCVAMTNLPRASRAVAIATTLITAACIWVSTGNDVADLFRYSLQSVRMAAGYGQAMQVPPSDAQTDVLGLVILALTITSVLVNAERSLDSRDRFAWAILLSAIAFIAFKSAYIRVDAIHLMVFLPTACCLAIISTVLSERPRYLAAILVTLSSLAVICTSEAFGRFNWISAFTGLGTVDTLTNNLLAIAKPTELLRRKNDERSKMQLTFDLPKIRATVQRSPIDIAPVAQGVLLLNDFNYRPRPVFQSYAAYSPIAHSLNKAFWDSANAPSYMLFQVRAVDDRLPAAEDAATLSALRSTFSIIEEESDFLLLQRKHSHASQIIAHSKLATAKATFGEVIQMPTAPSDDDSIYASIHIKQTVPGRIVSFGLREPRIFIHVKTTDGHSHTFRLVRESASLETLISPLLLSNADMRKWMSGHAERRVSSIRLTSETALGMAAFKDDIAIEWSKIRYRAEADGDQVH